MLIGLDFDNTIVCYDKAIAQMSDEWFELPPDLPRTKLALREYLRRANREAEWTAFQGALYGPGLTYAEPFEQAFETIKMLQRGGHTLHVISHRSLRPYAGPAYDLHAMARSWVAGWLTHHNLIDGILACFNETLEQKIAAINRLNCEIFLDDLPQVLDDKNFPKKCQAILFDPEGSHIQSKYKRIAHWSELSALFPAIT